MAANQLNGEVRELVLDVTLGPFIMHTLFAQMFQRLHTELLFRPELGE